MQENLLNLFSGIGVQLTPDALLVISSLLFACIGFLIAHFVYKHRTQQQLKKHTDELEFARQVHDDQIDQMSHAFSSISQQALRQNNESFMSLAKQSFEQLRVAAAGDLSNKQQSFTNLVKPIEDSIKATEEQLRKFDASRQVSDAKLSQQIRGLMDAQVHLQSETRNLSTALRRPEVRGQWGELTLRRLVELAGLSEHCDFSEQTHQETEDGWIRPDMIIRLPSSRSLIIDAKTPLDAYIAAAESTHDDDIKKHLARHAKQVRQRVTELASKRYWAQFEQSPDFVILFIPGDQFLSSALQSDPDLLEAALAKKVLLATPTSLVGLMRAIAYGWNQSVFSENIGQLKIAGQELGQRLITLTEHLNKLGRHLDQSVTQFNQLVGSFQQSTTPAVRRFSELGLEISEDQPQPTKLTEEKTTRQVPDHTQTSKQSNK